MRTGLSAWVGAVALGFAAPVGAQVGAGPAPAAALAPGEILLHINAQGSAPADYATFEVLVSGQAKEKDDADAQRREAEQDAVSALTAAGIAESKIERGEPTFLEYEDFDWSAAAEADAAMAVDAAAAAVEAASVDESETVEVEAAPYDIPFGPQWNATSTLTVTVDDLAKLNELMQMATGNFLTSRPTPQFRFRDEAGSKRVAISSALAEARADAEAYAEALGYRVVRIVAVSNEGPEFSLPSFLQAMTGVDAFGQDWAAAGRKIVPVSVDFVIAPK